MYNMHPYFSLKNFDKKVCIVHGKIQYVSTHKVFCMKIDDLIQIGILTSGSSLVWQVQGRKGMLRYY